jgi:integrase
VKLTQAAARALKLPAGKSEAIIFDDEIPGFGLRLRAGGSRTWVVQYKIGDKHRRLTLGSTALLTAEQARNGIKDKRDPTKSRDGAVDILARVRLGQDPASAKIEARAKAADTFGVVTKGFLTRQKKRLRPRSYIETERFLLVHWKPLHGLALAKISRNAVAAQLAVLADSRGPIAADRARAALSSFYTWAIREGLADTNPVMGTNKAAELKSRERVLADAELAAIWKALPFDQYGAIVRMLILTGQRRQEIGGLRWSEIDRAKSLIALSGERTKNGRPHDVPLSPAAVAILERQPLRVGRELVFGERAGPFQGWSKAKVALDKAIAKNSLENGRVAPWRLHDVRRTVATRMADLGIQPHVVEAVLNHVSGHKAGVAGIYNRSVYAAEKRAALDIWGNLVLVIAGERTDEDGVRQVPAPLERR